MFGLMDKWFASRSSSLRSALRRRTKVDGAVRNAIEQLENRVLLSAAPLGSVPQQFDFGTASSSVEAGYTKVSEATAYGAALGYGWLSGAIQSRDRSVGTALTRDFDFTADGTFVVDAPNGSYDVILTVGDATVAHDQMEVYLEGVLKGSVTTAANQFKTVTYRTMVSDGQLTLRLRDAGGGDPNVVINAMQVAAAPTTTQVHHTLELVCDLSGSGSALGTAPFPLFDPALGTLKRVTLEAEFGATVMVHTAGEQDVTVSGTFSAEIAPTPDHVSTVREETSAAGHTGPSYDDYVAYLFLSVSDSQSISEPDLSSYIGTSEGMATLWPCVTYSSDSDQLYTTNATLTIVYDYEVPEVAVEYSGTNVADGDSTPSAAEGTDFGTVAQGAAVASRVFTVRNTGTGTATTSSLSVPSGFSITEPLSASIPAGGSDTFTVTLNAGTAGTFSGQISFTNNDADGGDGVESPFNFSITGTITPSGARKFDFGTTSSLVETGYTRVAETTKYSTAQGYGWLSGTIQSRDRGAGTALTRDFNFTPDGTFVVDVPNGSYEVVLTMGDATVAHDQMGVYLEGALMGSVTTAANQFQTVTYQTTVSDGQLTLRLKDPGGADPNAVISAMEVQSGAQLPTIYLDDVTVSEGNSGTASRAMLSGRVWPASTQPIYVDYHSEDGTATLADTDYLEREDGLWIPAGATTWTLPGPLIRGDDRLESDEYLYMVLWSEAKIGRGRATVTIVNNDSAAYFDFGTDNSPVEIGYAQVTEWSRGARGYGWQSGTVQSRDRGTGTRLTQDFNFTPDGTFFVNVPNGSYDVVLTMGDATTAHDQMGVYLEGVLMGSVTTAVNQFKPVMYRTTVSDGQLTLRLRDLGGADPNVVIDALEVRSVTQAPPAISIDDVRVTEGNSGTGSVTITGTVSSWDGMWPVKVQYVTTDGTATLANGDYVVKSGTITISPYSPSWPSWSLTLPLIRGDYQVEPDEYFYIELSNPINATIGRSRGKVTIVNDDAAGSFDFGTASSPVEAGCTQVTEATRYSPALGYGWLSGTIQSRDRGVGAALTQDLNLTTDGTFVVDVPNGSYDVVLRIGDATSPHDQMSVSLENTVFFDGPSEEWVDTATGDFKTLMSRVEVTDGQLTLGLKDLGGTDPNAVVNAMQFAPAPTAAQIRYVLRPMGCGDVEPFYAEAPFPLFDPALGTLLGVTLEAQFYGSMMVNMENVEAEYAEAWAQFKASIQPTPGSLQQLEISLPAYTIGPVDPWVHKAYLSLGAWGSTECSMLNISDYIGTGQGTAKVPLAMQFSTNSGTIGWGESAQLVIVYDYEVKPEWEY